MATQSEDFKWFVENLKTLYDKYPDKYLVIQDEEVVGDGNTFEEALNNALSKGCELGTFIIQQCGKDQSCYTQSFSSRVVFA